MANKPAIDIDDLKDQIESIQEGVEQILNSGITDKALLTLIQRACPSIAGRNRNSQKPSIALIKAVIEGMENLQEYVFGDEEDQN